MEQKKIIKTHRVGTLTFGGMLVIFGALFLLHVFIPALNYSLIFRLWPFIFIFLGIEILVGNCRASKWEQREDRTLEFVYDKTAIFLIICLSFFAMIMAAVDYCLQYNGYICI